MRQRKPANIAYDLERFSAAIVACPESQRGRWLAYGGCMEGPGAGRRIAGERDGAAAAGPWREVRLDLGCGKGAFLAAAALAEPDVLFVGVDSNEVCVARAAQKVLEAGVRNAVVFCGDGRQCGSYFAAGELSRIYLNFNSPFPKRKYAEQRLTHLGNLLAFRDLLAPGGFLDLRTDNVLYWEFTLGQLELARYRVTVESSDLHADAPAGVILQSEYDERTVARGARVRWLQAAPEPLPEGVSPEGIRQTKPLSLVDYLPADLDAFDEVPYGMEDTLANMRNRRANAARRAVGRP